MRRFLLAGAFLLVVITLLVWRSRGPGERGAASAPRAADATASPAAGGRPVAPARPPREPGADAAPLPAGSELDEGERALGAMKQVGRDCWARRTPHATPPGAPDETTQALRVSVQVVVDGGEGRAGDVTVLEDRLMSDALRACLLEGLRELRWPTPGPAGAVEVRAMLRMGELTAPDGPPAAPSGPLPSGAPRMDLPPPPPIMPR